MSTRTALRPGTLVGVLTNGATLTPPSVGTCLIYGSVVSHDPEARKVTVSIPGNGERTVSDHGDYIEAHDLNDECEKCGAAVWRNTYRGPWEGIPDVDATGSAKCPAGGFHGAHTDR